MAEFVKVVKEYKRMCELSGSCSNCPMCKERNSAYTCRYWMMNVDPEAAEKIIMKWAIEHQPASNLDKFKEVFGFDPFSDKHIMCGTPILGWFGKEYKEPGDELD